MGKFLDRLKQRGGKVIDRVDKMREVKTRQDNIQQGRFRKDNNEKMMQFAVDEDDKQDFDNFNDYDSNYDRFDEVNIQRAQKPESFHHFILENQYRDLEMDIRGYKEVWDKAQAKFVIKRKERHCFTDEEAESIVRKAQSDLSTDIKLSRVQKEAYGLLMMSIFNQLLTHIRRIMEYRFGRFGSYEEQGAMKSQAVKIFDDLYRRISANYSRAIDGNENKETHQNVKGQESLQGEKGMQLNNRGYL